MCMIDIVIVVASIVLFSAIIYLNYPKDEIGWRNKTATVVAVVSLVVIIVSIFISDCNTVFIDDTVEMVVVNINYDTQEAELRLPDTNNGVLVSIRKDTPTIDVGDAVSVKLHKKYCKLCDRCNRDEILEHHSKILEVKEVK